MATPSKLDKAFEAQVNNLEGAQAEMVRSDFKTWKWNKLRIRDIEIILKMGKLHGEPIDSKARRSLMDERHKLITECTSLYSHINRALKDAPVSEKDEFDSFMSE